jgi:hypothetical protein
MQDRRRSSVGGFLVAGLPPHVEPKSLRSAFRRYSCVEQPAVPGGEAIKSLHRPSKVGPDLGECRMCLREAGAAALLGLEHKNCTSSERLDPLNYVLCAYGRGLSVSRPASVILMRTTSAGLGLAVIVSRSVVACPALMRSVIISLLKPWTRRSRASVAPRGLMASSSSNSCARRGCGLALRLRTVVMHPVSPASYVRSVATAGARVAGAL